MPIYCYRDPDGQLVELKMSYAEMLRRQTDGKIEHEGMTLTRDIVAEHQNTVPGCAGWPIWSDAAAVHPSDVPNTDAQLKSRGVNVSFDRHGRPKFENAAHRRSYLRAMKLHDRNGYD